MFQSLSAPLDDPRLKKEFYTRTYEQDEELGLNDMKVSFFSVFFQSLFLQVENYEALDVVAEADEEEEGDTEEVH